MGTEAHHFAALRVASGLVYLNLVRRVDAFCHQAFLLCQTLTLGSTAIHLLVEYCLQHEVQLFLACILSLTLMPVSVVDSAEGV